MTRSDQTDWDHYHRRPNPVAQITRRITAGYLLGAIMRHAGLPPAAWWSWSWAAAAAASMS